YDGPIHTTLRPLAINLTNLSALLWRLDLLGVDVGRRWHDLVDRWTGHTDNRTLLFADIHPPMAELPSHRVPSADRRPGAIRVTAASEREAAPLYRDVGVPLVEGLIAFHRGRFADAVEHLHPARFELWRMGGSHAQRDVIDWTLTEASIRAG